MTDVELVGDGMSHGESHAGRDVGHPEDVDARCRATGNLVVSHGHDELAVVVLIGGQVVVPHVLQSLFAQVQHLNGILFHAVGVGVQCVNEKVAGIVVLANPSVVVSVPIARIPKYFVPDENIDTSNFQEKE